MPESTLNNPLYQTVTRVGRPNEEDYGTGFFYDHNGNTYLVTNKHVLTTGSTSGSIKTGGDPLSEPDEFLHEVRIFLRNLHDLSEIYWLDVPLRSGTDTNIFTHPLDRLPSIEIDVAAAVVAGPDTLKNPATGGLRASKRGFALLGVHSETYDRPSEDGEERLNLNLSWYAGLVNEIIETNMIRITLNEW